MASQGPKPPVERPPKKPPSAVSHQLVLTALPNGVAATGGVVKLRLSVLLSMRLFFQGTDQRALSNWAEFANWPQSLADRVSSWKLVFPKPKGSGELKLAATPVGEAPDPELWARLFPPTTPVTSSDLDAQIKALESKKVIDYDHGSVLEYLKDKYVESANQIEIPRIDGPVGMLSRYSELKNLTNPKAEIVKQELAEIAGRYRNRDSINPSAKLQPSHDFMRFTLFHAPTTKPLDAVTKRQGAGAARKLAMLSKTAEIPLATTNLNNYYKVKRPDRPTAAGPRLPCGPRRPGQPSAASAQARGRGRPRVHPAGRTCRRRKQRRLGGARVDAEQHRKAGGEVADPLQGRISRLRGAPA